MAAYTNTYNITGGRRLNVQQPMDDRLYFENIGEIGLDLGTSKRYAAWYEYMTVYLNEEHTFITWLNINNLPPTVMPGAAVAGTAFDYSTDPAPFVGTKYANQIYQFFRINSLPLPHKHTEADITGLDKYTVAQVDNLLSLKQDNLPVNSLTTKGLHADLNNKLFWGPITGIADVLTNPETYTRTANAWVLQNDVSLLPITGQNSERLMGPNFTVLPGSASGGQYVLENPAQFPNGYSVIIMHNGLGNPLDNVELIGQTIDTVAYNSVTPYIIPFAQSMLFGIINGQWRRLNIYI